MIDKQKLLKFIEDKKFVYSEPYETEKEEWACEGGITALNLIKHAIESGRFEEK